MPRRRPTNRRARLIAWCRSLVLSASADSRLDNEIGEQAADAIVHLGGGIERLGRGEKIESSELAPLAHDRLTVEQIDRVLERDPADRIGIGGRRNHGIGARAVLHVHEDNVRAACLQFVDRRFKRRLEVLRHRCRASRRACRSARSPARAFRP